MIPFTITIKERLKPFSHTTWFRAVLPRTTCLVEIFPTALHIQEWQGGTYKMLFELTGPVKGFTVELDAHRGELRVFGRSEEGLFAYRLFAEDSKVCIVLERGELPYPLKMKQDVLDLNVFTEEGPLERLSLGMHRKQEWDQVIRRFDLREIFPTWLMMGSLLPDTEERGDNEEGNYALLTACKKSVQKGGKLEVCQAFENLFAASFSGLFVPHLNDPRFLGLSKPTGEMISPLPLLKESARLIRDLFFQEDKNCIKLLPVLPPQFHAGRFLNVRTDAGDRIDFEWTKKLLRRVIIHPAQTGALNLHLQKPLKSFRLRTSREDQGARFAVTDPLELTAGQPLFLDRFEK